ncbi:MAG TPA: hypothetical protein VGE76_21455 [Opitutaceae bacterium]
MKEIAQGLLIVCGGLGLFVSVPFSIHAWMIQRGFGGVSGGDRLFLYAPLICVIALGVGIAWRKRERKTERKSKNLSIDAEGYGSEDG